MLVGPRSGSENMARDMALMERARATGETVFSVYSWMVPTLSLGRNQAARGRYNLDAIADGGIEVVRRPTGGRALLHNREVTYSVTAPITAHEPLRDSYQRINRILRDGLARLGVQAEEAKPDQPARRPGDLPCFATPAEGELVTNGAKLVGSAQLREDGALLQHGSILVEDDQGLIPELLEVRSSLNQPPRAATLTSVLGRAPTIVEVGEALFQAVRSIEDPSALSIEETRLRGDIDRHVERFNSEWWTWRR